MATPASATQRTDSDGVVPTVSQAYGKVVGLFTADHLDVVGQYQRVEGGQRRRGWLRSRAGFDDDDFAALWQAIAAQIRQSPQEPT